MHKLFMPQIGSNGFRNLIAVMLQRGQNESFLKSILMEKLCQLKTGAAITASMGYNWKKLSHIL